MGELRRGFKAKAERLAVAVREELSLGVADPFDCLALASYLGIPIVSLGDMVKFGAAHASVTQLSRAGAEFSALTVCAGNGTVDCLQSESPPWSQG